MKKFLGIIVLGLLWCSAANAVVIEMNKCFSTTVGKTKISNWEEFKKLVYEKISADYEDLIYSINTDTAKVSIIRKYTNGDIEIDDVIGPFHITNFTSEMIIASRSNTPGTIKEKMIINLSNYTIQRTEVYYGEQHTLKKQCDVVSTDIAKEGGASGTAFFISNKGFLLTNNHVVEGCKSQKINYFKKEHEVKIIATDKTLDLALLKANVKPRSFISFSRDEPKKRQVITAAGYPLGKYLSDDLKINDGRISALKGFENNTNQLQHDIAINPGNSGGPIVNEKGQLVAIAVSGMAKDVTEGLNFGIKSSAATNFLKLNKISPSVGYMSFSTSDDRLVKLLEESTVYTFCK